MPTSALPSLRTPRTTGLVAATLAALVCLLVACTSAAPPAPRSPVEARRAPVTQPVDPQREADDAAARLRQARADDGVLRFAIISDLNGRYGSMEYNEDVHRAVRRIVELEPDLVISAGDMVAGQKNGLDYTAMWASFHETVTDHLDAAAIPLAVAPGNHDASAYPKFADERVHYEAQWLAHRPTLEFVDDAHYPFHYAFVEQGVLFVALDITTSDPLAREQRAWLDELLARHADIETKIVFGHVPLHPLVGGRKGRENLGDPALEALLQEHDVTMFISGHHHAYYPGRVGDLRLLGVGCLGGGMRQLVDTDHPPVRTLVVVEIDKYGVRTVEALAGPDFVDIVDRNGLPERLGSEETSALLRDDVGSPTYVAERLARMHADGLAVADASSAAVATGLESVVAARSAAVRERPAAPAEPPVAPSTPPATVPRREHVLSELGTLGAAQAHVPQESVSIEDQAAALLGSLTGERLAVQASDRRRGAGAGKAATDKELSREVTPGGAVLRTLERHASPLERSVR